MSLLSLSVTRSSKRRLVFATANKFPTSKVTRFANIKTVFTVSQAVFCVVYRLSWSL